MARRKFTKITVVAELYLENGYIYDPKTLEADLINQAIKVKSGAYENLAMGDIVQVTVQQKTPREDCKK